MQTSRVRGDQSGVDERLQGEQRAGRIAAGAGDEPRPGQRVAAPLRQSVDGGPVERGRRRIPASTRAVVAQPKGAGQVEDPSPAGEQGRGQLGANRVGQAEEDDVGPVGQDVERKRLDAAVPDSRKRRQILRGLAAARAHRDGNVDRGVARREAQQLLAAVAGCTRDSDTDGGYRLHQERRPAGNGYLCM